MQTVLAGPAAPVAGAPTLAEGGRGDAPARHGSPAAAGNEGSVAARPGLPRVVVLAAAGAAAIALAYALAPGGDDVVLAKSAPERALAPAAPVRETSAVTVAAAQTPPETPARARAEIPLAATTDPFAAASFVPPPPPAPVVIPPPPPPPKAPPLPFAFVGLLESGAGKPAAFLSHGEALLVVSEGDVIESDYRVESLSPVEVVLTYLPLKERQKLAATGVKP
ncbi:MAG TPA: hypothetical protein PLE54_16970 [Burkholderiaceae bacterium]|nr:hypothetical protein [Burkholderiaceae bacterium]